MTASDTSGPNARPSGGTPIIRSIRVSSSSGSNGLCTNVEAPAAIDDSPALSEPLIAMIGIVRVRGFSRRRPQ